MAKCRSGGHDPMMMMFITRVGEGLRDSECVGKLREAKVTDDLEECRSVGLV